MKASHCCVDGCLSPAKRRGMCGKHYQRFLKHGDVSISLAPKDLSLEDRFWSKVDKSGECWLWTGSADESGYGSFRVGKKIEYAHRVSYSIANGVSLSWEGYSAKSSVCHRCDNPRCVNPAHLFLGTHTDNMSDCVSKGRKNAPTGDRHGSRAKPHTRARGASHGTRTHPESVRRGDDNGNSKLTEILARLIKERYASGTATQKAIAAEFGIDHSTVSAIVRGRIWRHVTIERGALTSTNQQVMEAA